MTANHDDELLFPRSHGCKRFKISWRPKPPNSSKPKSAPSNKQRRLPTSMLSCAGTTPDARARLARISMADPQRAASIKADLAAGGRVDFHP